MRLRGRRVVANATKAIIDEHGDLQEGDVWAVSLKDSGIMILSRYVSEKLTKTEGSDITIQKPLADFIRHVTTFPEVLGLGFIDFDVSYGKPTLGTITFLTHFMSWDKTLLYQNPLAEYERTVGDVEFRFADQYQGKVQGYNLEDFTKKTQEQIEKFKYQYPSARTIAVAGLR